MGQADLNEQRTRIVAERVTVDRLFDHWLRTVELGLKNRSPGVMELATDARDKLMGEILEDQKTAPLMQKRFGVGFRMRSFFNMPKTGIDGERDTQLKALGERIRAKQQRLLKLVEVIERHGGKGLPRTVEPGPTPERMAKPQAQDSVERLYALGHLSSAELDAARSIARIFQASSKALFAKVGKMESAGRAPQSAWREPTMSADDALLHARVYVPWTEEIRAIDPDRMTWLLSIIVYSRSAKDVAREQGKRWATIVDQLQDALSRYVRRHRRHRARASTKQPSNSNQESEV